MLETQLLGLFSWPGYSHLLPLYVSSYQVTDTLRVHLLSMQSLQNLMYLCYYCYFIIKKNNAGNHRYSCRSTLANLLSNILLKQSTFSKLLYSRLQNLVLLLLWLFNHYTNFKWSSGKCQMGRGWVCPANIHPSME